MLKAKDFRNEAWGKLSGKWGTLAVITLVFSLILGACSALSFVGVGAIALILIEGPLTVGYVIVSLTVIRQQETKFEYLFYGFKNFVNTFVLYLLNFIFIFLWSLLLVIPGIIKALSYSMSYYILADHPDMNPNDARKASMEMMKGNKWRLFCLELSFIGWCILSTLTFGILYFWVLPYMQSAMAAFYESIKNGNAAQTVAPALEMPSEEKANEEVNASENN